MPQARILLIEDSPTYAKLASILLKGCGHAVLRAATGGDGLRVARDEKPDLILMDMQLPDMNGVEAIKLLRQDPETAGIPTVAMTADRIGSEYEREEVRTEGFDAYVEKPLTEVAFRALLTPFLGSLGRDPSGDPETP
jgi:two-component system cell cycle response regulator DivK